jgi:hypothetical protein
MPRKLRIPLGRKAPLLAKDGALRLRQITDLKFGPSIPQYMDTGEPAYPPTDPRARWLGFEGYEQAHRAWEVHGEQLMAEDPGGKWWGWEQWSTVTVGDLMRESG